ncbi:MAG: signal peptidase I [Lachnospiraceae bacterium]|nr:signal peptidase I [Lachnospiraceae bacterium]
MKKKQEAAVVPEEEGNDIVKGPKKGTRIANTIINVVLVVAIIVAAVATYVSFVSSSGNGVPSIFGFSFLSIQTDSMYPVLESGDLIVDKRIKDATTLRVGDIITYWTVIDGERVLNTHTIHGIYDGGSYLIFATKGENNDIEDPLTVHESELVGQYTGTRLKGVGKVFDFLQTSTGFLIVVVLPVAIFFIFHLIQFFRVLFEYQSVKNRLLYEQERGKTEDLLDEEKKEMERAKAEERAKLEAELRERLKKEILGSGAAEAAAEEVKAEEPKPEEKQPSEEEVRAEMEAKIRKEMEEKMRAEMEAKVRAEMEAKLAEEANKAKE